MARRKWERGLWNISRKHEASSPFVPDVVAVADASPKLSAAYPSGFRGDGGRQPDASRNAVPSGAA